MVRVVARGRRHPLCLDGGRLSSLWVVGPVSDRGGQSWFAGSCSVHLSWLVGVGGLWVIVRGWCVSSLVVVVIPCVRSWALAVVVLSLLCGRGCLPWYGDGFDVGQRVVVAVGGVIDVVVVGWRKSQRHTLWHIQHEITCRWPHVKFDVCWECCSILFGYVENDCYSQVFIQSHPKPSIYSPGDFDGGFWWDASLNITGTPIYFYFVWYQAKKGRKHKKVQYMFISKPVYIYLPAASTQVGLQKFVVSTSLLEKL